MGFSHLPSRTLILPRIRQTSAYFVQTDGCPWYLSPVFANIAFLKSVRRIERSNPRPGKITTTTTGTRQVPALPKAWLSIHELIYGKYVQIATNHRTKYSTRRAAAGAVVSMATCATSDCAVFASRELAANRAELPGVTKQPVNYANDPIATS